MPEYRCSVSGTWCNMPSVARSRTGYISSCAVGVTQLTCFAPPLEQQHINAAFLRIVAAEYYLHPSVYGPFLLELSDPLSRVVVEWDMPWLLVPSWNVRSLAS